MGLENKQFDKFTGEVCSQIKCTEVHSEIKEELDSHLEEIKEEFMAQGATSEEADRQAIAHMGDSEKIGFDLNKVYQKKPEYKTLIITSIFIILGLFLQFVIEKNIPSNMPHSSSTSSIVFTLIGVIIGIVVYMFDYRKLENYSMHLFVATNLFVIFSLLLGIYVNGVLTVSFLGGTYNVAFVASTLYIISLSGILPKLYSSSNGVIKITVLCALCSFMLLQTKGSYLFVFFFTAILLLIYIGFPKKYIWSFLGLATSLLFYYVVLEPYRVARFTVFLHFKESKLDIGYLNYRIYELLSSSNPLGNGISKEIFRTTPSLNQELIYCYIIYTFGWLAGATIFTLITILLVNLFKTSKFIKNRYGKILFLSISSLFTIEFLLSVLMNLNLAPIVGIPMPFISYGRTSTIINITLIGLICSIYGRKNLSKSLIKIEFQSNLK